MGVLAVMKEGCGPRCTNDEWGALCAYSFGAGARVGESDILRVDGEGGNNNVRRRLNKAPAYGSATAGGNGALGLLLTCIVRLLLGPGMGGNAAEET